jgi:hypothetical protein
MLNAFVKNLQARGIKSRSTILAPAMRGSNCFTIQSLTY